MHAELRLGLGLQVGRKRVARLMRAAGITGICHQRKRNGWRPAPAIHEHLAQRRFTADAPDRVSFTDVAQHRAADGWVQCCAVIDALQMARWQRRPAPGAFIRADRGSVYTSWVFGHRLRVAGLLGSMGKVASSVDNALIESFWSTMPRELLDRRDWHTRAELATASFEWIEGWDNPHRRHSSLGTRSSTSSKPFTPPPQAEHDHHTEGVQETGPGSTCPTTGGKTRP